jgi:hypothetical protein
VKAHRIVRRRGLVRLEGLGTLKKKKIHLIGTRTSDLPTCSASTSYNITNCIRSSFDESLYQRDGSKAKEKKNACSPSLLSYTQRIRVLTVTPPFSLAYCIPTFTGQRTADIFFPKVTARIRHSEISLADPAKIQNNYIL